MAIKGIFASHQHIVGERTGDFQSAVLQYFPTGQAAFTAISSGIPDEGAGDTTFHWNEDAHISGRQECVSGGLTNTIVVEDGSFYIPNQLLLVEQTGEILFVQGAAGNTLTVLRGLSGTTPTSISNQNSVQLIGSAHEESSEKPVAVAQQGAPRSNVTHIFRNAWAVSGTAKAVRVQTGDLVARNRQQCMMYHSEDMERAFLFSRKHVGTLNNKQFRLTDGIIAQIEKYGGIVTSAASDSGQGPVSGSLHLQDFYDWTRRIFETNVKGQPNERIVYNGNIALQALQQATIADSSYEITAMETEVGIKVMKVCTPFGDLKFMTHAMMNENPTWTSELYALHPGGLKRRTLRPTFPDEYDRNGTRANGIDADEGLITTEMGVQAGGTRTMGIYRNIRRGARSPIAQ